MKTQVWFTFVPSAGKVQVASAGREPALLCKGLGNRALCFCQREGVSFHTHDVGSRRLYGRIDRCITRQAERPAPPGKARVANGPVHPGQRCVGSTRERHVFRRGYAKTAKGLGGTGRFASSTLALEEISHKAVRRSG